MNDEEYLAMNFYSESGGHFVTPGAMILDPPRINVYLAGPLTNNDPVLQEECDAARTILKRLLRGYDYLGMRFEVYDPGDVTQPGSTHIDEEVYTLDYERTVSADLVVFHVNSPSLGVGCESQIAADAIAPRVTISKRGVAVSRMFKGISCPSIVEFEYSNCSELELSLSRSLLQIARRTVDAAHRRRRLMALCAEANVGQMMFSQRIIQGIPLKALSERTNMKEFWLERLEHNPLLGMCVTNIQLASIAEVVNCFVKTVHNQVSSLVSRDELLQEEKQSLSNLVEYIRHSPIPNSETEVFRVWKDYVESSNLKHEEAMRDREGKAIVMTPEQWKRRLNPQSLYG